MFGDIADWLRVKRGMAEFCNEATETRKLTPNADQGAADQEVEDPYRLEPSSLESSRPPEVLYHGHDLVFIDKVRSVIIRSSVFRDSKV